MKSFAKKVGLIFMSFLIAVSSFAANKAMAGNEVNLYSYRQPFLIMPLLNEFNKQTGIVTNVVYAKKGMLQKIKAKPGSADAVLTVDISRLSKLEKAGLLQPIKSSILNRNIPSEYRHPKGFWYGLTTRARIVYASKERVKKGAIKNYEDLADPKWKGKICIRSGKHVYNISLFASIINAHGSAAAEKWLRGLHSNLARKPQGNDRAQVKGIYSGVCDLAIGNTYYMGKMQTNKKKPVQKKWAKSVYLIFPNQENRGTHVNISGAAVTKSAKNKGNAVKLIEFLSGKFAQKMYAHQNFEYPVKSGIAIHSLVESWGSFQADNVKLSKIANLRGAASKLVDKVNFNK